MSNSKLNILIKRWKNTLWYKIVEYTPISIIKIFRTKYKIVDIPPTYGSSIIYGIREKEWYEITWSCYLDVVSTKLEANRYIANRRNPLYYRDLEEDTDLDNYIIRLTTGDNIWKS